jgi:hypothetical protein
MLWSISGGTWDGIERRSGITLWTVPDGEHLVTFRHEWARWFDIFRYGELAITADRGNFIRIWRLNGPSKRTRRLLSHP